MEILTKKCGLAGSDLPHEVNNGLSHDLNEDNMPVCLSVCL
jgi:hypothetical protein